MTDQAAPAEDERCGFLGFSRYTCASNIHSAFACPRHHVVSSNSVPASRAALSTPLKSDSVIVDRWGWFGSVMRSAHPLFAHCGMEHAGSCSGCDARRLSTDRSIRAWRTLCGRQMTRNAGPTPPSSRPSAGALWLVLAIPPSRRSVEGQPRPAAAMARRGEEATSRPSLRRAPPRLSVDLPFLAML